MSSSVEVVYFIGCPNATLVFNALKGNGIPFEVVIQDRLPKGDQKRALSSPSVLVNGVQVFGEIASNGASSCTWSAVSPEEIVQVVLNAMGANPSALNLGESE